MFRNLLNLQGNISIIDLEDITHRLVDKQGDKVFDRTVAEVRRQLEFLFKSGDTDVQQKLRVLVRGMKWNVNLKDVLGSTTWDDAWSILNAETSDTISANLKSLWQTVDDLATTAAYAYASFNMAVRYHNLYQCLFPGAFRATVHAKPGQQIAVPRIGDVYPWNGVATLLERGGTSRVETWPLHKLITKDSAAVPFRLPEDSSAFYYRLSASTK